MTTRSKGGFTLIELLVVISIIGILAAFALVSFSSAQARARDTRRKNDLNQLKKALQAYYNDNGRYPTHLPPYAPPNDNLGYCCSAWSYSNSGASWIDDAGGKPLSATYIKQVPVDPKNTGGGPWDNGDNYLYAYSSNGPHYNLVAHLENTTDPDRCGTRGYRWTQTDSGASTNWCAAFGGVYSNQIYAVTDD